MFYFEHILQKLNCKTGMCDWSIQVGIMQTMRTQLAVIGGGPAGVCAAIAAARHGIQTMLVTDRPVLGGNSSSEIRVWTRGATGAGNLWAEEMGVWGELKLENLYRNSDANPVFWDETLLDAVLREKNLTLLLNTEIYEVELDGGRVAALRGVQQSSEWQFHIEADYFIDATGDGTVSAKAGVPFSVGNGNHETLGNSILYYTRREDHPVSFIAPDYAYDMSHIEKILGCGGRIINERMSGSDCWWFEYGGLRDTISNAQDIALELRRLVLGVWNYVKNSGKFDADCYTLDWIGSIPGKRESRPWGGVNAWIAAPEDAEPWAELRWDAPVAAREVRLYHRAAAGTSLIAAFQKAGAAYCMVNTRSRAL